MMTAEQLRDSILLLAMQGKLVEQRQEEGSGEELYRDILRDRERLVSQGEIKKEKNKTYNNDESLFDIPESWQWAKLNDIVAKTIKRGKSPKYSPHSNTLVFAQKCNTKAGVIDLSLCQFLNEAVLSKYPADEFMVDEDIVINSTGNGTLGRVGMYRDSDNHEKVPIVPDSHITIIRSNKLMDAGYVYYCLKYYQPYMEKLGSGSTNQTELGADTLKALAFPIPPLEEQKRIVAKIEELLPFVEQYADASTKLNTLNTSFPDMMKKSILQEAVRGKLVPQDPNDEPARELLKKIAEEKKRLIKEGKIKKQKPLAEITEDEIPFEIPESWEWVRLQSLCKLITKGSSPKWQGINYVDDGLLFVTSENVGIEKMIWANRKHVDFHFNEVSPRSVLKKGDLLTNIVGASIGRTAIYDSDEVANINQAVCIIRLVDESLAPYIMKYLNSTTAYTIMMSDKVETARPNISLTNIEDFLIPLPPLAEQKRIVAKVEELMSYIDALAK